MKGLKNHLTAVSSLPTGTSITDRFWAFRSSSKSVRVSALTIIGLGVVLQVGAWWILPPSWKIHAVFNPIDMPVLDYIANFEGYKPSRMPFFDVLSAAFYLPLSGSLGYRALGVYTLVLSCVALPVFYSAVKRLFDEYTALYSLALFALYPKLIFLVGRSMPEATASAFIAFSLYGLSRAFDSDRLSWYAFAGGAALLAYLMFVSAVLYAVLVALLLYVRQLDREVRGSNLLPRPRVWAFSLPPGVVGVAYLVYGPVKTMLETGGINKVHLFVTPDQYTVVEKSIRYFAYTYFDFWWHTRGFDQEKGILPTVRSLGDFFGVLSPVYFLGWITITAVLSACILYGLVVLANRRDAIATIVLAVAVSYVVLFHYRNLGWAGAFQTRHVFPLFPMLCVSFGVGTSRAVTAYGQPVKNGLRSVSSTVPEPATLGSLCIVGILLILVFNGGAQAVIQSDKEYEGRQEPVFEMTDIVEEGETVGVIRNREYHDTVTFSNGDIRPTILHNGNHSDLGKFTTRLAPYQTVDSNDLSTFDVTYVYFKVEYEYMDRTQYRIDVDQAFIDRLTDEGTVVYHNELNAGSFRTTDTDIFIVRLEQD